MKQWLQTCAKYRVRSSCAYAKYHSRLCSPFIHSAAPNNSVSKTEKAPSDSASMQSNLDLHCQHMPEDMFLYGAAHVQCALKQTIFQEWWTIKSQREQLGLNPNPESTFTTLWANSADDKVMAIFLFFPENKIWQETGFDISFKLSPLANPVFWGK